MAQVRVVRKGVDFKKAVEDFKVDAQRLKKGVLVGLAGEVAMRSPVDSGYYATSHEVGLRSGSFEATYTRPVGAPRASKGDAVDAEAARQRGFQNMVDDINSLDLSSENFVIRNPMAYSALIEAGDTGDVTGMPPVYASAVREAPRIIQEVAQKIKSRTVE